MMLHMMSRQKDALVNQDPITNVPSPLLTLSKNVTTMFL